MDLLSGLGQPVLDLHRELHQELARGLSLVSGGADGAWRLALVALGLGAVHALTPGHGKAILFTYFIGRQARPWAGFVAAAQVAALHIATAAVLVLGIGGSLSLLGRPAGAAAALQVASAAAVAAAGCWYSWRAIRPTNGHVEAMRHPAGVIAVGLLPCPLTMMILSAAYANGNLAAGGVLVALMGVGIMLTIAAAGTSAIFLRRGVAAVTESRRHRYGVVLRGLEIGSALLILALGMFALAGSLAWI